MESLAQLQPDLLLLGGDYTSQSLLEMHEEDARTRPGQPPPGIF